MHAGALAGFQATLDEHASSTGAEVTPDIATELARSLHDGVCEMVVAERLPAVADDSDAAALLPALLDAAIEWERQVHPGLPFHCL